jgi:hypothetical protein
MTLLSFQSGNGMVVLTFQTGHGMSSLMKGLIRGDAPLARKIFKDETKRRLIPKLQQEGWPIFNLAGKRCGIDTKLDAHARKVAQRRQRRSKGGQREEATTA